MNYELNRKIAFFDKALNIVTPKSIKIRAYCGHCGRVVFRLHSKWAKQGLCVYCWESQEGIKK